MNQPLGRLLMIQYRGTGKNLQQDVLRVHLRTHLGTETHHDLDNSNWGTSSPALKFMAAQGFKPSDFDGTTLNLEADDKMHVVEIAPKPPDSWGIAESALSGGEDRLEECDWFHAQAMSHQFNKKIEVDWDQKS